MGTSKVHTYIELDFEDFNRQKFEIELNKHGLFIFDLTDYDDDGVPIDFKKAFLDLLADIEISASISFTVGCMYTSNGDVGYPDEESFEDFFIGEDFTYQEKKINIQECLTKGALKRAEEKIYAKLEDSMDDEQCYEND